MIATWLKISLVVGRIHPNVLLSWAGEMHRITGDGMVLCPELFAGVGYEWKRNLVTKKLQSFVITMKL